MSSSFQHHQESTNEVCLARYQYFRSPASSTGAAQYSCAPRSSWTVPSSSMGSRLRSLPRHSGAPFHASLSVLDFGTCSGLHLPVNGEVVNRQDSHQLRTLAPPFAAFSNDEIDPRLHDERERWPIDGPSWMLPMSCDSAYSYASKRYPSLGISRKLLYNLFAEDADLLRHERRNYSHGNAVRLVPIQTIGEAGGTMSLALYALHPVGPFMNVLQLSQIVDSDSSLSSVEYSLAPTQTLLAKSSIDIDCTIVDISTPAINYKRCDRLVVVTTTSQFTFFVRLRTEDCRCPQIELLHRLPLSAQPFPSISNPFITHECSLIADDGVVTIYDASTCSRSYAQSIDSAESVWLRQAYTCHPRVIHIASRRRLRRLDLRTNNFENVANSIAYNNDGSNVITAFNSDLHNPFSFVVCDWENISCYDERYTARPVLRWLHHRQKRPITHLEISTFGREDSKVLTVFGHDSSYTDVYRYSMDVDGSTTPLSSPQQLDVIKHTKLRGIAFSLRPSSDTYLFYRLTELGTIFLSTYVLVNDDVDHGEPCPVLAAEEPLALLSRSNLIPYDFIDFSKPIQDLVDSNSNNQAVILSGPDLVKFISEQRNSLMQFLSEWRTLSDIYKFLRASLQMPAAVGSLAFYNAISTVAVEFRWSIRIIPALGNEEVTSNRHAFIAPPNFPELCSCAIRTASNYQPSSDCSYPDICQALLRSAICSKEHVLDVDLEDVWAQAKDNYLRTGTAAKKSVDLSADMDALMSLLNANENGGLFEESANATKCDETVMDEVSIVEMFQSLRKSWDELIQSDLAIEEH